MKIGQNYTFAPVIFTTFCFLTFVAQAYAGISSGGDSLGTDTSTGIDDGRQYSEKNFGSRPNTTILPQPSSFILDSTQDLTGSLIILEEATDEGTILLAGFDTQNVLAAQGDGDKSPSGGGKGTKGTGKDDAQSDKTKNRPAARPGTRKDLETLLRWLHYTNATQLNGESVYLLQGGQLPQGQGVPEGLSDWSREALRRLREYGPGNTPPQGWAPADNQKKKENKGSKDNGRHNMDAHRILTNDPTIFLPPEETEYLPPYVFLLNLPQVDLDMENLPVVEVGKPILVTPGEGLPELKIEYVPLTDPATITLDDPENAKRLGLLAGAMTVLLVAAKFVPQLLQACANAVPIFIIMPDESGMLMIQGGRSASPRA